MFQRKAYPILALLTAILLLAISAQAQEMRIVKGKISAIDGVAVQNVNIVVEGRTGGTISNKDGNFTIEAHIGELLHFSHVSFYDTSLMVFFKMKEVNLVLREKTEKLKTVEIMNDRPPDVVFGHAKMHVADLELVEDGLLLLTYDKERRMKAHYRAHEVIYRYPKLVLADRDQNILDIEYLAGEAIDLHRDHLGRTFIVGRRQVHLVELNEKEISLIEVPLKQFQEEIEPCVAILNDKVYFSNYDADYPSFSYFSFNLQDSSYNELCTIEDTPLMDLFRSQYKYMSGHDKVLAMDMELSTGVDAEIIAAYMTGFQHDKYYDPLYAPMFVQNDEVLVFDHYNNVLRKYREDQTELGKVELSHHTRKPRRDWKKKLLHDETTGAIYTLHEKCGKLMLYEIDIETGQVGLPFVLFYKYAENLHVDNGEVYYIYRPFGSLQKKYLYKEEIR